MVVKTHKFDICTGDFFMTMLSVGLSGLLTSRDALSVSSNNVANSSNPTYKRQLLKQASGLSQFSQGGYVGQGVKTLDVSRVTNQYLYNQILKTSSEASYSETLQTQLSRVDNIFAEGNNALSQSFANFNAAAQDLSLRPADNPARQQFLAATSFLVDQFNSVSKRFDSIRADQNAQIEFKVREINDLTASLGRLNNAITREFLNTDGKGVPLNLLDERDELVLQLAEKIDIQVVEGQRGETNILMRQGQPLVLGGTTFNLLATTDITDPETVVIGRLASDGSGELIRFANKNLGRGELAALLEFRDTALNQYQNTLGLMALGFADQVNSIQTEGFELLDDPGPPPTPIAGSPLLQFASVPADPLDNGISRVVASPFNADPALRLAVAGINTATLPGNEYEVFAVASGAGVEVRYRPVGSKTAGQPVSILGAGQFEVPGAFQFSINGGGLVAGDSFNVRLTARAGLNLRMQPLDLNQIVNRAPGGGLGDNTQILKFTQVLDKPSLLQRGSYAGISIQDMFSRLVSVVGNDVVSASNNALASNGVLESLSAEQSAVSGVNLDEEAAKLIQFQQAYAANSKVISLSKDLFDELLNAIR
ncbi:flagellar hook-associated protein FlgK [Limnobacter sp.]|uniref:flagellar hook-associated protein FlgK n=1 Tax=Limnobacter sp. TaxID=2003368 RepID=UPI0035199567